MKIEKGSLLDQAVQNDQPFAKAKATSTFQKAMAKADAYGRSVRVGQTGYEKEDLTEKSAVEEFQDKMGAQMDAADRKRQMAVLSNTLTPEDYKKLQEAGFSLQDMEGGTIVTVTDKIKTQLAKAGVDVSGMGTALTKEQLEEIGGSVAAANQLERCFEASGVPATEENMADGLKAWQQAKELTELSEGAIKYLIDNHLPPSIDNLYLAEFSGSSSYQNPQGEAIDFGALREQMEQVILASGAVVDEKTLADSRWMIENDIAFTAENFTYMQKLDSLKLPVESETLAPMIATAVAEGDRPKDAMLLAEYSVTARAEHAVRVVTEATDEDIAYLTANHMEITVENLEQTMLWRRQGKLDLSGAHAVIDEAGEAGAGAQQQTTGEAQALTDDGLAFLRARRVLEETRLAMTTEANRMLIRQGISIDTKPLQELVESLKEQESNYYAALLEKNGQAADASGVALFEETARKVSDLKGMPAYLLGMRGFDLDTVNGMHEAGSVLRDTFEKAGERYETLMTAPRSDLGDSIQKAFANVEDILADLGLENSEANSRAVRILAYNRLEINEESILTMKAADERVQRTFANLTPATVRELIHRGVPLLDMDLDTLNRTAQAVRGESGDLDVQRFSEYLWKLDQSHEITSQERESLIGVYRLMHQIEKTDGAAIGALVSQGAEFTMQNLLSAVRSAKKSGMDYTVDDDFAGVDKVGGDTKSITDQIASAYQADCMRDVMETLTPVTMQKLLEDPNWENYTPEQLKQALTEYAAEGQSAEAELDRAYADSQLGELKAAAAADEEVYRLLERFEIPNTVGNVLAANRLINRRNQVFSRMFNSDEVFSGGEVDFAAIQEEILARFGEAIKTPKEMAAAQEALAETAENVMKTMLADDEHITSMDIRELKLMNAQLSIAGKMAGQEEYTIPVLIKGEVTNVSLKIVRGEKKKGLVEVMFEAAKAGKVAASIEAKEKGISALVAADSKEMKELLDANAQEIARKLGEQAVDVQVTYVKELNFSRFDKHHAHEMPGAAAQESEGEAYQVQTSRLYKIAKGFMEAVKELS